MRQCLDVARRAEQDGVETNFAGRGDVVFGRIADDETFGGCDDGGGASEQGGIGFGDAEIAGEEDERGIEKPDAEHLVQLDARVELGIGDDALAQAALFHRAQGFECARHGSFGVGVPLEVQRDVARRRGRCELLPDLFDADGGAFGNGGEKLPSQRFGICRELKPADGLGEGGDQFPFAPHERVEVSALRGQQRPIDVPKDGSVIFHRKRLPFFFVQCKLFPQMSDFHQSGVITTFHRLGMQYKLEDMEQKLAEYTRQRPLALILPCLASEMERPALKNIVARLKKVPYIAQIVVGLDHAERAQFQQARRYFGRLPQEVRILWRDGTRLHRLAELMRENDISVGGPGKGSNIWLATGLVLADDKCKIVALHDCDIATYNREMLARLVFPVANPNMDYIFCKGYYARVADRLYGRVTRLMVTPLIRALQKILGRDIDLLNFLDSFRYPLSGEFSMATDLARINRIPADWGLEIGVLCEMFRNVTNRRICQVDLANTYEHKHQSLSADDAARGLTKMTLDIAKSLFRNLATEGVVLSDAHFKTLSVRYLRAAQDAVKQYEDDAAHNALPFDRHDELRAVAAFTKAIRLAADEYLRDPLGIPLISNWNRVTSAIPDFYAQLKEAVDLDNEKG